MRKFSFTDEISYKKIGKNEEEVRLILNLS